MDMTRAKEQRSQYLFPGRSEIPLQICACEWEKLTASGLLTLADPNPQGQP